MSRTTLAAPPDSRSTYVYSRSNLTLFRYHVEAGEQRSNVHCPHHSDVGLLTVIPRCVGAAGLHIWDWERQRWADVEEGCPDDLAVVFAGESLQRLTNNYILAAMHEVADLSGTRISGSSASPAPPSAILDHSSPCPSSPAPWSTSHSVARSQLSTTCAEAIDSMKSWS